MKVQVDYDTVQEITDSVTFIFDGYSIRIQGQKDSIKITSVGLEMRTLVVHPLSSNQVIIGTEQL